MAITQLTEFAADELVSRANVNSRVTDVNSTIDTLTPVQLYYNASGSAGTIPLSSSIANFQVIEIFFAVEIYSATWCETARIYNGGSNSASVGLTINISGTYSSGGTSKPRVNTFGGNTSISGTSLTRATSNRAYVTNGDTPVVSATSSDTPKIYKVIGYKY